MDPVPSQSAPTVPPASANASPARAMFAILLVAAVVYSAGIVRTGFEGQDERRYALVAKEIALGHGFFVMHYLRETYPDKPPLFFWSQALAFKLAGGISPFAARLPLLLSALGALGFAFLTARAIERGRPGGDEPASPGGLARADRVALLATAALALSFRFVWSAKWARLDTPMLTWTFAAFWASAELIFPRDPLPRARERLLAVAAWAFAALAVLAKGPGGLVWMLTIAAYAAVRRDASILRRHHPLLGVPVLAAICLAWLIPAMILGGEGYYGPMIGTHVVERFAGHVRHEKPFWYFLPKIFSDPMPVSLLLPVAAWFVWGGRRRGLPEESGDGGRTTFSLTWFLFMFAFFSFPTGKRSMYILPLYPPLMLIVARFVDAALHPPPGDERGARARRLLARHLILVAGAAILAAVVVPFLPERVGDFVVPRTFGARGLFSIFLACAGGVAIVALLRDRLDLALGACTVGVCTAYLVLFGALYPVNRDDSVPRAFGKFMEETAPPDADFAFVGASDRFCLYTPGIARSLDREEDDDEFAAALDYMASAEPRRLVVDRKTLERFAERSAPAWHEAGRWDFPEKKTEIVLLLNEAAASGGSNGAR